MSFGSIYRRDKVTYTPTTRHPRSNALIPGTPVTVKAYVEWYNTIRPSESGNNPKQLAIMLMGKKVAIKAGDMITKVVMQDGTTYDEREYEVQMVSPQGGFKITHKEVQL